MRLLLFLFFNACLLHICDGKTKKPKTTRRPSWYDFWKEPAEKINGILAKGYVKAVNFTQDAEDHKEQLWEGLRRMWIVFWYGVCREKIKMPKTRRTTPTTTTVTTTTLARRRFPTWPRGWTRKNPLIAAETDFVKKAPKSKKPKKPRMWYTFD